MEGKGVGDGHLLTSYLQGGKSRGIEGLLHRRSPSISLRIITPPALRGECRGMEGLLHRYSPSISLFIRGGSAGGWKDLVAEM